MNAPHHHPLRTQRVDQNNMGNPNLTHIEARSNSMKEITAHVNNDQQTCLSTTERKLNSAQASRNLTENSGTKKLQHSRKKCNALHNIKCAMDCGYVSILPCRTTLDIRLNVTTGRTQTTAHLDADLHQHGTRTANVVHD